MHNAYLRANFLGLIGDPHVGHDEHTVWSLYECKKY